MSQRRFQILQERVLPVEALGDLVIAAGREGDRSLRETLRLYNDGTRRFDGRGDAFYASWGLGAVIGVLGMVVPERGLAQLSPFYVHPNWRLKGVAGALLARAMSDVARVGRGVSVPRAVVINQAGIALLKKRGFRPARASFDRSAT